MLPAEPEGPLFSTLIGANPLQSHRGGIMDAHLIGIDLFELLLKQKACAERQRPVKAGRPASESAVGAKAACAEPR